MNIDILIVLINLFSVGLLMVTVMELVCNSDIGLFASNMPLWSNKDEAPGAV